MRFIFGIITKVIATIIVLLFLMYGEILLAIVLWDLSQVTDCDERVKKIWKSKN